VKVVQQDTSDPSQDGHVQSQDPGAQSEAAPKSTVTITVGRFVADTSTTTQALGDGTG
jgi:beta-lactam-binding protein with PASTA domain